MKKIVSGVYRIKNIVNGKVYIGSSVNIVGRLSNHKKWLSQNIHGNKHLQNAYNKYGDSAFIFEIYDEVAILYDLKTLTVEQRRILKRSLKPNILFFEQLWLDNFESWKPENGYNKSPTAGSNLGIKVSEEQLVNYRGKVPWNKGLTKETDERIVEYGKKVSESLINNPNIKKFGQENPFYGKKHSEEQIKAWSDMRKGIPFAEEHKNNMKGKIPWNKGLSKNDNEILAQMSKKKIGKAAWNKGLTKETDERIKGHESWNKGLTKETSEKVKESAEKRRK